MVLYLGLYHSVPSSSPNTPTHITVVLGSLSLRVDTEPFFRRVVIKVSGFSVPRSHSLTSPYHVKVTPP